MTAQKQGRHVYYERRDRHPDASQRHAIRTRTLGVSTVIAIYSAAVIGIARYPTSSLSIAGHAFHLGSAIAAFGVLLLALLALDRGYYYRMLIAAVEYARELEQQSGNITQLVELALSTRLSLSVTRRSALLALWLFYVISSEYRVVLLIAAHEATAPSIPIP